MRVNVANTYTYFSELRSDANRWSVPLLVEDVTADLGQLVEETYVRGLLAEELPWNTDQLDVEIAPSWSAEPMVKTVEVTLVTRSNGARHRVSLTFDRGPWVRSAEHSVQEMRAEGALTENEQVYRLLVALNAGDTPKPLVPRPLMPPPIVDQSLSELGIAGFGDGSLEPDRPVLVSNRLAEEAITQCESSGPTETGGAVLGKNVRLPKPLPGTRTRIVTVLTALLDDARHTGDLTRFHISPEALIAGDQIAALRGRRESVITIVHTHGWGCGDCNEKACLLAECFPSLQDYELESLFPTKALLLPIAGRRHGAPGRRPVLQIHAWRGGELRPIRWLTYYD
jgi:hypothetical protein